MSGWFACLFGKCNFWSKHPAFLCVCFTVKGLMKFAFTWPISYPRLFLCIQSFSRYLSRCWVSVPIQLIKGFWWPHRLESYKEKKNGWPASLTIITVLLVKHNLHFNLTTRRERRKTRQLFWLMISGLSFAVEVYVSRTQLFRRYATERDLRKKEEVWWIENEFSMDYKRLRDVDFLVIIVFRAKKKD